MMQRTSLWSLIIVFLLSLRHFELAHATASHLCTLRSRLLNPENIAGGKENLRSHYQRHGRVGQLSNEEICWNKMGLKGELGKGWVDLLMGGVALSTHVSTHGGRMYVARDGI